MQNNGVTCKTCGRPLQPVIALGLEEVTECWSCIHWDGFNVSGTDQECRPCWDYENYQKVPTRKTVQYIRRFEAIGCVACKKVKEY